MALRIIDLDKHIGNARVCRDTSGEKLPVWRSEFGLMLET